MRVLLDTNVLISYLLAPDDTATVVRIMDAAFTGRFTLLVSDQLVDEMRTVVVGRARLAQRIAATKIEPLIDALMEIGEHVDTGGIDFPHIVRDPKDDYLIVLATLGNADVLVTGDRDLLELNAPTPFRIVTLTDFVSEIGDQPNDEHR